MRGRSGIRSTPSQSSDKKRGRFRSIRRSRMQNSFFLANSAFLSQHADVIGAVNAAIAKATAWAGAHRDETAALFAEASGVDVDAQKRAVASAEFSFGPIDDKIIAQQQAVADRFSRLGLIPAHVPCAISSGPGSRTREPFTKEGRSTHERQKANAGYLLVHPGQRRRLLSRQRRRPPSRRLLTISSRSHRPPTDWVTAAR